jgi:hypothetical protein
MLLLMLWAAWRAGCVPVLMLCVVCSSSPRFARLPDMERPSLAVSEEGSRADSAAADLRAAISAARAVGTPLYTRVVSASPAWVEGGDEVEEWLVVRVHFLGRVVLQPRYQHVAGLAIVDTTVIVRVMLTAEAIPCVKLSTQAPHIATPVPKKTSRIE